MRVLAHAHSHYSHDSMLALSDWIAIARELGVGTVLLTDHEETGWDEERFAEYVRDCRAKSTRAPWGRTSSWATYPRRCRSSGASTSCRSPRS